jgi:hypothetical protein
VELQLIIIFPKLPLAVCSALRKSVVIQAMALELGLPYVETSAVTGELTSS